MEKIGIIAGTVAFLGVLLLCTWHHSTGPDAPYSSDTSPATTIPPIASALVPPPPAATESPLVSLSLPTLETTANASPVPTPTDHASKDNPLPQPLMLVLRSKVVEFYADSDMPTPKGWGTLHSLLPILRNNPMTHVEIAGHTDNLGAQDYNLVLSQRRAEVVRSYFISRGISEQRLVTQGYGSSLPIADNATAEGRQRNRRAEIIVHPSTIGS